MVTFPVTTYHSSFSLSLLPVNSVASVQTCFVPPSPMYSTVPAAGTTFAVPFTPLAWLSPSTVSVLPSSSAYW